MLHRKSKSGKIRDTSRTLPRINDTSPVLPRISQEEFAKGIGATVLVEFLNARQFTLIRPPGGSRYRKVPNLSERQARNRDFRGLRLGATADQNFVKCVFLARQHIEKFWESVGSYRIVSGEELDPKFYYAPTSPSSRQYPVEVHWYRRVPVSGARRKRK